MMVLNGRLNGLQQYRQINDQRFQEMVKKNLCDLRLLTFAINLLSLIISIDDAKQEQNGSFKSLWLSVI